MGLRLSSAVSALKKTTINRGSFLSSNQKRKDQFPCATDEYSKWFGNAILGRVTLLLLLFVSLATIGCTGDGETTPSSDGGSPKKVHLAIVTNQAADFWTFAKAGGEAACKDLSDDEHEVTFEFRYPSDKSAEGQIRIVEDLISKGVDGVAISPISETNMNDSINSWAKKIKVVTHDSDAPASERTLFIGMDNYEAGKMAGRLVKEALPKGGKVALFIGRIDQMNSKARRQGVIDEILGVEERAKDISPMEELKNDKYTIVGTFLDEGTIESTQKKAEDVLTKDPDIACMVGLFEYNPPGILNAVRKRKLIGKVKIVGFDENMATLEAIRVGEIEGTIVQNPYEYGYDSIRQLLKLVKGEKPEKDYFDHPARMIKKDKVIGFRDRCKSLLAN